MFRPVVRRNFRPVLVLAISVAVLAAVVWIGGCSPDHPLPPEALAQTEQKNCGELTYENFGADFFARYCLGCHNEQISGDIARTDAPNGINFNKLDGIRQFQRRIYLRAGEQGDMPPYWIPVPKPSVEERIKLMQWIDCGSPNEADLQSP